jgi:hypothetical protein
VKLDRKSAMAELSVAQTVQLLAAALNDSEITWTASGGTSTISSKGTNAVLLKKDEFQGRLGTPGALFRKCSRPGTAALPQLPTPEIAAASVGTSDADPCLLPFQQKRSLMAELRTSVTDENSDKFADITSGKNELSIYRLVADKLLMSVECWPGAYNSGEDY